MDKIARKAITKIHSKYIIVNKIKLKKVQFKYTNTKENPADILQHAVKLHKNYKRMNYDRKNRFGLRKTKAV